MHDEEWVQFAVVEALARINDPAAIIALIALLPLSSVLVSSAIVDALGELGDIKQFQCFSIHWKMSTSCFGTRL